MIAHKLFQSLHDIEAPSTRFNLLKENVADSIRRCKEEGDSFKIDTITCPLYQFSGDLGPFEDFSVISGIGERLDDHPRYRAKFQRYLATVSRANQFLQQERIPVRARVYFGNAGILNAERIKEQLGITSDNELRDRLAQNASVYQRYVEQKGLKEELGIHNVPFEFTDLTEVVPTLKDLPLDLCEVVETSGFVRSNQFSVTIETEVLVARGVTPKVRETAEHTAHVIARGRAETSFDAVKRAYLEVLGFLETYGQAGKSLTERNDKTDLLVSADPPGSYRADFYYAYLKAKGAQLAIMTPNVVDAMPADLQEIFRKRG